MASNDSAFQRYLDAGIAFTNMTRARAEDLVAELVQNGEFQRKDARAKVDELIERSRRSRAALVDQVRREVARQLDNAGITNLEELADRVVDLLGRTAEAGRAATARTAASAKKAPAKKAPSKKAVPKKAVPKKAPSKKAPSKKASAKKAVPKKAAVEKVPANKAAANTAPVAKAAPPVSPAPGSPG
ncbi:MAG: phasin family protein [Acidimicrobiales bacterium]